MPGFLRQSTASQSRALGPFLDSTDFLTPKTGLTIANTDVKLVVNGGASANKNSGGGTHRVNGVYGVTFDATDTATVGELEVSVVVSGALPVFDKFFVVEETVYDALFAASAPGYLQSTVAARTVDVSAGGEVGVDWANVGSPTTAVDLSGTTIKTTQKVDIDTIKTNPVVNGGTITFPTNATVASTTGAVGSVTGAVGSVTGAVGSVTGAVGSVTGAVGSVAGNVGGNVTGSVGSVATGGIAAASFAAGAIDAASIAAAAIGASEIATDAIDADALAADAVTEIVTGVFARAFSVAYSSLTFDQVCKVAVAVLAGKLSGAATTTVSIRNLADSADVVVATVDANGNRSAVTITP